VSKSPRLYVCPLCGFSRRDSTPLYAERRGTAPIHILGDSEAPCKITSYEAYMGRQPWRADSRSWRPAHAADWLFPVSSYIEYPTTRRRTTTKTNITTA
jgi:hypothetical protein